MKTRLNDLPASGNSWKLALTLLLAAASAGVLVLDNVIGVSIFISPLVASLLLTPVYVQCGLWPALGTWAAVTAAGFALVANPITSALYAAFGYYPIVRSAVGKLSTRYQRFCVKFGYCNIVFAILTALVLQTMDRQTVDWLLADTTGASIFTMVLLANIYFALFDFAVGQTVKLCTALPKKLAGKQKKQSGPKKKRKKR